MPEIGLCPICKAVPEYFERSDCVVCKNPACSFRVFLMSRREWNVLSGHRAYADKHGYSDNGEDLL